MNTAPSQMPVASRRRILQGCAGLAILALPGCATIVKQRYENAVRRLMERASRDALARLMAPDGFWNSSVARLELPDMLGRRGSAIEAVLMSPVVREKLQRKLNRVAEKGARRAAPLVADVVRTIGKENAEAIIRGGPNAATRMLRGRMAGELIPAMVPELAEAMRMADDPILGPLIATLAGEGAADFPRRLAEEVDNSIWAEIGATEAAIRADPQATGDPVLIEAFGSGG